MNAAAKDAAFSRTVGKLTSHGNLARRSDRDDAESIARWRAGLSAFVRRREEHDISAGERRRASLPHIAGEVLDARGGDSESAATVVTGQLINGAVSRLL